jgi:hypothetical protein
LDFFFDGLFDESGEGGIAIECSADDAVVVTEEGAVVFTIVGFDHLVTTIRGAKLTDAKDIDIKDLKAVGGGDSWEFGLFANGVETCGDALGVASGPDAIEDATVFGHITSGEDIGLGSDHAIIDKDTGLHFEVGLSCQVAIGSDAGGEDDQLGGDLLAVGEADAAGGFITQDFFDLHTAIDGDALLLEVLA